MRNVLVGLIAAGFITILIGACTEPTELGLELLEEDQLVTGFTDTLTLRVTTVRGDSVRTSTPSPTTQNGSYLVGNYVDPVFGSAKSAIYIQPRLRRTSLFEIIEPDFDGQVAVDSVVLVLPYREAGTYGIDYNELHNLSVYELDEAIDVNEEHFSNETLATKPELLGDISFRPSLDSITIIDYTGADPDTIEVPAQLRIPLSNSLGIKLLNADSASFTRDSLFLELLKGVAIVAEAETSGLLSFGLNPSVSGSSRGGIFLYYHQDTEPVQYQFAFNEFSGRFLHFEHDYAGSYVAPFIDNTAADNDTISFVQGMEGLFSKIELPGIADLKGNVVNKAELEVYVAAVPGDDTARYDLPQHLVLYHRNEDGKLVFVDDVMLAAGTTTDGQFVLNTQSLATGFGGTPIDASGGKPQRYLMNLTTHLQEMIDGGTDNNTLFLAVYPRWERASRVSLYGPKHPAFPMKLKVTFTKL